MKRWLKYLAAAAILIGAAALVIDNWYQIIGTKTYKSDTYGFEFKYPADFYLDVPAEYNPKIGPIPDLKVDELNEDVVDENFYKKGKSDYLYKAEGVLYVRIEDVKNQMEVLQQKEMFESKPVGTILSSWEYGFTEIIEVNGQKLLREVAPENLDPYPWDHIIFYDSDKRITLYVPLKELNVEEVRKKHQLEPVFEKIVSSFKFTK
jgi:hypothetical protein